MRQIIFVTAPFPIDLERRARICAARQRISRAELVRLAVNRYLNDVESEQLTTMHHNEEMDNERD